MFRNNAVALRQIGRIVEAQGGEVCVLTTAGPNCCIAHRS